MDKPAGRNNGDYADYCVYTIRHSNVIKEFSLSEGPHTIYTKKKPWTGAKQMISNARRQGNVVPLLFAPAEDTTNVVACADLLSVKTGRTNSCTFENVRNLTPPLKKTQLKKRNGQRIDINFIRDYAICKTPLLKLAGRKRATKFDIGRPPSTSIEAIREFVARKKIGLVLNEVAHSISVAHEADPSKWGLRINQKEIMLKVGRPEVLQVGEGWFHLLLKDDLVSKRLRSDRRLSFSDNFPYKNAPGCVTCNMDISIVPLTYRALRSAHEAAIRIAARSPRHTTTAKDHSPNFINFLSEKLSERLPQPAYYYSRPKISDSLPEEISGAQEFEEGAVVQILINRYERDPAARERCITHYGAVCIACGLSLADQYGPEVYGLIHVHHLTPLAGVGKRAEVDPVRDLRPVCPNCHAVIHSTKPPRTIDEVKNMVRGRKP